MSGLDFSAAHAVLQAEVDQQRLAGVSAALMRGGELIDSFCTGLADVERGEPLRPDHIHRAFSNTKLVTSVLVLMLAATSGMSLVIANDYISALIQKRLGVSKG